MIYIWPVENKTPVITGYVHWWVEIDCFSTNQRQGQAPGIYRNVVWGQRPRITEPPYRIYWRCGIGARWSTLRPFPDFSVRRFWHTVRDSLLGFEKVSDNTTLLLDFENGDGIVIESLESFSALEMLLATSEWLRFQPTWRANSWRRSFTIRPPSPTKVKPRNFSLAMSVVYSFLLRYLFPWVWLCNVPSNRGCSKLCVR